MPVMPSSSMLRVARVPSRLLRLVRVFTSGEGETARIQASSLASVMAPDEQQFGNSQGCWKDFTAPPTGLWALPRQGRRPKTSRATQLDICTTLKFAELLLIRRHDGSQRRCLRLSIHVHAFGLSKGSLLWACDVLFHSDRYLLLLPLFSHFPFKIYHTTQATFVLTPVTWMAESWPLPALYKASTSRAIIVFILLWYSAIPDQI